MAPFGVKVLIVEPGVFRTNLAGAAMKHMPILHAYAEIVGGTRDVARGMDGTQSGNPRKAAAAIDAALAAETTLLRLQLGQDAVETVRAHAEKLLADLAAWEGVAIDTRIDRAAA